MKEVKNSQIQLKGDFMKTVTLDVFKFEELSPEVQEKVITDFRENAEYFDEGIIEDLTHFLTDCGFSNFEIAYSLDYSHVPFAEICGGSFNKPADFTEIRKKYCGEALEIIDLIEQLPTDYLDVGSEEFERDWSEEETEMMGTIDTFVFKSILNDCENYFSTESIAEGLISMELDYLKNGVMLELATA